MQIVLILRILPSKLKEVALFYSHLWNSSIIYFGFFPKNQTRFFAMFGTCRKEWFSVIPTWLPGCFAPGSAFFGSWKVQTLVCFWKQTICCCRNNGILARALKCNNSPQANFINQIKNHQIEYIFANKKQPYLSHLHRILNFLKRWDR